MSVAERTIGRSPATGPFGGATAAWTALVGDGAGPTWLENGGGFSVVVRAPAFARAPTTPGVPLAARGSGVGTWTARGSPSGWIFSLLDGAVAPDAMGVRLVSRDSATARGALGQPSASRSSRSSRRQVLTSPPAALRLPALPWARPALEPAASRRARHPSRRPCRSSRRSTSTARSASRRVPRACAPGAGAASADCRRRSPGMNVMIPLQRTKVLPMARWREQR